MAIIGSKLEPSFVGPVLNADLLEGQVPVVNGGTGVDNLTSLKTNLNLDNVDNTSDANKPISTAQASYISTAMAQNVSNLNAILVETEAARDEALAYGSSKVVASWSDAVALTGLVNNYPVFVLSSDTGTHTSITGDVGSSNGQTPNSGYYLYSTSLSNLVRVADLESSLTKQHRDTTVAYFQSLGTMLDGYIYQTIAAGLADPGVPNGAFFPVITADNRRYDVLKINSTTSGQIIEYPTITGSSVADLISYKAELLSNVGTSRIGHKRTATNSVDILLNELLEANAVTPEEFGAVSIEDGASPTVSQTTSLINALNSGRLVNCHGKHYKIAAPISPSGTVKGIVNGKFSYTTTTEMDTQQFMLSIIDKDDIRITDCEFDLGSIEATSHTVNGGDSSRGAIKLTSSNEGVTLIKRPIVERNKITGSGNGTSIYVRSAIDSKVNFNIIHDRIVTGTDTNDTQNGIDTSRSKNVVCIGNIINGLYYRVSGNLTRLYSRGFVTVEVTGGVYNNNFVSNCDQGLDFSGAINSNFPNGNTGIICSGNVISDVHNFCIKFANCSRDSIISNNICRNFGWTGIIISGQSSTWPADNEDKATGNLLITNNYILDPANFQNRTDCFGIWITFRSDFTGGMPSNVRIINNTVRNSFSNSRLQHGIVQSDGDRLVVATAPYNEVSGNTIIGQTGTPTKGCFPGGLVVVSGDSSQNITSGTWTEVLWNTETVDGEGMHSNTSTPERLIPTKSGWYQFNFSLLFLANSTGIRQARVQLNGASLPGGDYAVNTVPGVATNITGSLLVYINAGQYLKVEVYQNSGSGVNLARGNSQASLRRIAEM